MLKKTVIISGGFGDIGKATAIEFAKNNYNIALTYLNSFDAEFIKHLKTLGSEVLALRCDVTNESEIINFVKSASREFEYIDAFVCASGKAEHEDLLIDKKTETIDDLITVNLRGTILFNREILKLFVKQKHGSIVNISSIYGEYGGSMESTYSACKAGIIGLTKSLATEVAPIVRVNAVAPGYIETKMTSHLSAETKEYVKNQTPLSRLGTPEDVAKAVYFLASENSSFITGEVLTVSGGATTL